MQKALVLGGKTGMLGQDIMLFGQELGIEMHSLGRENGDVLDLSFLEKEISALNPDFIFNTIAYTAVDNAEDDKDAAFELNNTLPQNLAKIIRGSACHCVHYSTDFVFDGKKNTPYYETDETNPLCVYGSSKLAGESPLATFNNCAVLRTAWLFGVGRKNFVSTIISYAKEKPSLSIVHDQVGSPTCTKDLAHMSFLVARQKKSGLFHGVNSGSASWYELACEAISLCGLPTVIEAITSDEWPQKACRPKYSVLSNTLFTETFHEKPRPWQIALKEYILESKF